MQEPDEKQPCEDQDENTLAKSLIDDIIEETEKEEVKPRPSQGRTLRNSPINPS